MGFVFRCAITTAKDADEAASLIAGLTAAIPYTRGRAFERPFRGVIVGAYTEDLVDACDADPSAFAVEDSSDLEWMVSTRLPEASLQFPGKRFAFVDVDCFGGTCFYSGEIVCDGEVVWQLESLEQDGHLQLFARLGLTDLSWHFPPFERGFLDGEAASDEVRRPIVGVIDGHVGGLPLERLAPILFVALQPDWAVRPIGEGTILLMASDQDVALSINAGAEQHALGGRSHVAHDLVARLLDVLAETFDDFDASYQFTLANFGDRETVQRWSKTP